MVIAVIGEADLQMFQPCSHFGIEKQPRREHRVNANTLELIAGQHMHESTMTERTDSCPHWEQDDTHAEFDGGGHRIQRTDAHVGSDSKCFTTVPPVGDQFDFLGPLRREINLLVVVLCLDLTGSVEWTVHAQSKSGRSPVREAVLRDVGRWLCRTAMQRTRGILTPFIKKRTD